MKQKTRILIYILIAAAAVMIGVIAVFSKAGGGESALGHIDLGRTYLIELSYDKAVIEFTEAIRIDSMNADAYLGLAEAYEKLGDKDNAIEWLEMGFELTGDERVREMLDRLKTPVETEPPSETVSVIPEETTFATSEETTSVMENKVRVPYLLGKSEEKAVKTCEEIGLKCEIFYSNSSNVEMGYVISQSTPAAAEIDKGAIVQIEVSEGVGVAEIYIPSDHQFGENDNTYMIFCNGKYKANDNYAASFNSYWGSLISFCIEEEKKSDSFGYINITDIIHDSQEYVLRYNDYWTDLSKYGDKYFLEPKITVYDTDGSIIQRAENEYDSENKLLKSVCFDSAGELLSMTAYTYNENGNIAVINGSSGSRTEFLYDDADNCIKITGYKKNGSEDYTYEYKYDNNRRIECRYKDSDGDFSNIQWKYDNLGNVVEMTNRVPDSDIKKVFDKNGYLIERYTVGSLGDSYAYNQNYSSYESYEYDENGNLFAENGYYESNCNVNITESLYQNGKKVSMVTQYLNENNPNNTFTLTYYFSYDQYGRITEEKSNNYIISFTYNENGNMVNSKDTFFDNNGKTLSTMIYSYVYDEQGRVVKNTFTKTNSNGETSTKTYDIKYLKIEIPKIFIEQIKSDYGIDITE